jgi:hypothetical protein
MQDEVFQLNGNPPCTRLHLGEIKEAYAVRISKYNENFKMLVTAAEAPTALFEVYYQVSVPNHIFGELEPGPPRLPVRYCSIPKIARILYINRLDKYAGPCEVRAIAAKVPAKYCVCQN